MELSASKTGEGLIDPFRQRNGGQLRCDQSKARFLPKQLAVHTHPLRDVELPLAETDNDLITSMAGL